jgi:hypothetical protein
MSEAKVAEWIESQKGKHVDASLRLRHIAAKPATVDEWRLDKFAVLELAHSVWEQAVKDAALYKGVQRYELNIVATVDGRPEDKARYGFRMDTGEAEEPPETPLVNDVFVGFMKQTFSHNEVLMRMLVQLVTAGEGARLRELERLTQRTDSLERQLREQHQEMELSRDKNHERALAKAKFENDEKRMNELMTTSRVMIPYVVNGLAKKNLLPTVGSSPVVEAIKVVFESLSPEQYEKIQGVLTPAQLIGLAEAIKLAKREENENDAEQQRKRDKKD